MPLSLSDRVVAGELSNAAHNTVHGWLWLRDRDEPVILHLTGNCEPDLAGLHIRFQARPRDRGDEGRPRLASQQIGPTGKITTLGRRSEGGLYLEWFGPDGHVVADLEEAAVQFLDRPLAEPGAGVDAALDDVSEEMLDESDDAEGGSEESEEDPYGLFDEGDAEETPEVDWALEETEEEPADPPLAYIDGLLQEGEEIPAGMMIDPPVKLYPPHHLDDAQVADALQFLLARLAQHNIALDMCEHYTPRAAYRLLVDHVLREELIFPQLPQAGFVQHFMTHEYCEACEAEMEGKIQEGDQGPSDLDEEE